MAVARRQHLYGRSDAATTLTAAADWVQKALNPAHGVLGPVAIPDTAAAVTACGEWRANYNLAAAEHGEHDDYDIVIFGSGCLPLIWRAYASGSQPHPGTGWTAESYPFLPGGDPAPLRMVDQYRTTYLGVTLYFNAPAMSNQGRIIVGQIPNSITTTRVTVDALDSLGAAKRLMAAYKSGSEVTLAAAIAAGVKTVVQNIQELVPLSEEDLTQYSPQTYSGLAKSGCYVPVKFIQPVHNYVDVASSLGPLFWRPPEGDPFPVVTGTNSWPVVGGLNTHTTVILLRGVDKTASLMLKYRQGFEAICSPESLLAAFQYETVLANPEALTAVAAAQQVTPAAHPAAANDFLGVLRTIGKALTGRVSQGIARFLQGSGIPVVSQLAGPVAEVMKAANGML